MNVKVTAENRRAIRKWLVAQGHPAAVVCSLSLQSLQAMIDESKRKPATAEILAKFKGPL